MRRGVLIFFSLVISIACATAQQKVGTSTKLVQKRYNIFFKINDTEIDRSFKNNAYILNKIQEDIEATLATDGTFPDSLLILSTASPDGRYTYNRWLASERAKSTEKMLLKMFPQLKEAHLKVEYIEEDWDGLRQILKSDPNFPQREEMLAILDYKTKVDNKEKALRALKKGWRYLVNNHIYALRNSSITICVIMRGEPDEFIRHIPLDPCPAQIEYTPEFKSNYIFCPAPRESKTPIKIEESKMVMAVRSNLIAPGLNVGIEVPIGNKWSAGVDYWYPWFVSKSNKWCAEQLALFIDGRYWFTGEKYRWTETQKLQGHAIGIYMAAGYYDYQSRTHGKQGEYFNIGIDYTFALPVAQNRLRLEFNIGIGFVMNEYRPYKPSTDFSDLIKDPGIKYRTSNFFGPTRGGVSLVVPIMVKHQNNKFRGIKIGGERL